MAKDTTRALPAEPTGAERKAMIDEFVARNRVVRERAPRSRLADRLESRVESLGMAWRG